MRDDIAWRAEFARYRARMYGTAAAVFDREPSEDQLASLVRVARASSASSSSDDSMSGFVRKSECDVLLRLSRLDAVDLAALRMRVAEEYAALFVGPRPPLAPLYESVYIGAESRLCTEETEKVRRFYRRFGFEVTRRKNIPDDHIAFELEFLSRLCEREADAIEVGNAMEARRVCDGELEFIVEHLGRWIGAFVERVDSSAHAAYYSAWARFVQDVVEEDVGWLQDASWGAEELSA